MQDRIEEMQLAVQRCMEAKEQLQAHTDELAQQLQVSNFLIYMKSHGSRADF